jgi:hypothetical protein
MRDGSDFKRNEDLDRGLDALFAAYRDACPELEASADFMPRLWARIEGRRENLAVVAWRRWAQAFVSLAAAACLFMGLLQVFPQQPPPSYVHTTYVEQLSEDEGPERLLLQEIALTERMPAPAPDSQQGGADHR